MRVLHAGANQDGNYCQVVETPIREEVRTAAMGAAFQSESMPAVCARVRRPRHLGLRRRPHRPLGRHGGVRREDQPGVARRARGAGCGHGVVSACPHLVLLLSRLTTGGGNAVVLARGSSPGRALRLPRDSLNLSRQRREDRESRRGGRTRRSEAETKTLEGSSSNTAVPIIYRSIHYPQWIQYKRRERAACFERARQYVVYS